MTDKNNVIALASYSGNATHLSPEELLKQVSEEILDENSKIFGRKKMLIICLDDENGNYSASFRNAGLSCSEIVCLTEYIKRLSFELMGL